MVNQQSVCNVNNFKVDFRRVFSYFLISFCCFLFPAVNAVYATVRGSRKLNNKSQVIVLRVCSQLHMTVTARVSARWCIRSACDIFHCHTSTISQPPLLYGLEYD